MKTKFFNQFGIKPMNMNQKGFVNIALIVVIIILAGAVGYFAFVKESTPPRALHGSYTTTTLSLHDKKGYFEPGIYYQYNFSKRYEEFSKPVDINSIFDSFSSQKIPIQEVWYQASLDNCCPPDRDYCTATVIQPNLLVRLSSEDSRIERFNFIKIDNPDSISWYCAYSVAHYIFN